MKLLTLCASALAVIAAGFAFAQTPAPAPTTPPAAGTPPYIALYSSGTSTAGSTWYIDTASKLVVMCQSGGQGFACVAQSAPTSPGGMPAGGGGSAASNPLQ